MKPQAKHNTKRNNTNIIFSSFHECSFSCLDTVFPVVSKWTTPPGPRRWRRASASDLRFLWFWMISPLLWDALGIACTHQTYWFYGNGKSMQLLFQRETHHLPTGFGQTPDFHGQVWSLRGSARNADAFTSPCSWCSWLEVVIQIFTWLSHDRSWQTYYITLLFLLHGVQKST